MKPPTKTDLSGAAIIAAAFIVLALAGSFFTSRQMNNTADQQAMSAGRPGDAPPNLLQEQKSDQPPQGAPTGKPQTATVPPAR